MRTRHVLYPISFPEVPLTLHLGKHWGNETNYYVNTTIEKIKEEANKDKVQNPAKIKSINDVIG